MTSETDLTDSIITNNTNIVNDNAEGSSGDSNHVITSAPDSIPEATGTVGQSTDTDATSGTVNTVTTQTSANGLHKPVMSRQSDSDQRLTVITSSLDKMYVLVGYIAAPQLMTTVHISLTLV